MNPSTALATVIVDELVRCGVRHAVLCPGSRSAPLAYALQEADRAGWLTLHVRVDERSAGFLALGLAKLTRVPAVVVTTSGTAVANLHPAVLEAHHGVVPLIVLTADRPVELRGTGANQTTVQPGIFGTAVRWSLDLPAPARAGSPEPDEEAPRWRSAARMAVAAATGTIPRDAPHEPPSDVPTTGTVRAREGQPAALPARPEPGPVHLNVQLREPLVPTVGGAREWDAGTSVGIPPSGTPGLPAAAAAPHPTSGSPATGATRAPGAPVAAGVTCVPRTLVVVGDLPDPAGFGDVVDWARHHGWPVVAEPFGSHPRDGVVPHGPLVLGVSEWLDAHAPERVLTVGRVTLTRPVTALLRRPGTRVEAVRTHRWIEATPSVAAVHEPEVLAVRGEPSTDHDWLRAWVEAGRAVAQAVAEAAAPWPCGLAVATALVEGLPPGATLFVGSSNAVRDLDLSAARASGELTVVASRGLAGIDGCVSTAAGVALAGAHPAYALMGDLTFLHDANGLLIGPDEPCPDLTIVVTNDDGGGIFTLLEPGEPERAGDFERIFGTPTGTDLSALCSAHGVAHQRVSAPEQLRAALGARPAGLTVLEVAVDRRSHRRAHARLREAAAAALS